MSKAEEKALEAYPSTSHYWNAEPDRNAEAREFYKQGYRQAEKDLELTWEDIKHIYLLVISVSDIQGWMGTDKSIYQEVLKRFKESKKNKP